MITHRSRRSLAAVLTTAAVVLAGPAPAVAAPAVLTNLAHLDFLTDTVTPPAQAGHTTYRLDREPSIGVLWVYADDLPEGGYRRVGGGAYDAATDTYGQGAYDADDVSRAAVVYLRHWKQFGDRASRNQAYQQLRGLTYMQTASGPNAGNVVLWMQPDGTLNPSPVPIETPDPSDSGGVVLARAHDLGPRRGLRRLPDRRPRLRRVRQGPPRPGHRRARPAGAQPLRRIPDRRRPARPRMAGRRRCRRQFRGRAGPERVRPGRRSGHRPASALARLAAGIAEMGGGNREVWPYGAVLPWALSRSLWHAWGAQMPSALAEASTTLHDGRLLTPAVADAAAFTPRLLTATGPINGWLPAPIDGSQIAYGADARVQGLLSVSRAAHSAGLRQLAGVAAGWFFGQNPAGAVMYNPRTGATNDGVNGDGTVNLNSGAESTIHGLLTMLALDANPDLTALAKAGGAVVNRDGQRTVEAESGRLSGPASVVVPDVGMDRRVAVERRRLRAGGHRWPGVVDRSRGRPATTGGSGDQPGSRPGRRQRLHHARPHPGQRRLRRRWRARRLRGARCTAPGDRAPTPPGRCDRPDHNRGTRQRRARRPPADPARIDVGHPG